MFRLGKKRKFPLDDEFFEAGNWAYSLAWNSLLNHQQQQQQHVNNTESFSSEIDTDSKISSSNFKCTLPNCSGIVFPSLSEFEAHYTSRHVNVCQECGRILPTQHWLSLHLTECHDSYFQAMLDKRSKLILLRNHDKESNGPNESEEEIERKLEPLGGRYGLFACLVEGCKKRFENYKARRWHCRDAHGFNAFTLAQETKFLKKSNNNRHGTIPQPPRKREDLPAVNNDSSEMQIDDLAQSMAQTRIREPVIPQRISFGGRKQKRCN